MKTPEEYMNENYGTPFIESALKNIIDGIKRLEETP